MDSVTRRRRRRTHLNGCALLAVCGALVLPLHAATVISELTSSDIARAISIATAPARARATFHAPYIIPVADSTVERLEVVTEFRRFVLASEAQTALGNWMLARGGYDSKGRTLKDMLQRWRGVVSIRVRLRFHPHHRYSAVPIVDILLDEPTLLALETTREALGARAASPEEPSIMTGAVVETAFNAPSIANGPLPVRIVFEGEELVREMVDFAKLE